MGASLAKTPDKFGVFRNLFLNPSCVPNLKLLASKVAEISRGSQIMFEAAVAQTPASFRS